MISKTNLYWQVYKNLEREFLTLSDTIHINDSQQEVYSMKIADLLIRTAIEIEAIAKELYLANGGDTTIPDEDMYFDTVCMQFLNSQWLLEKKVVLVTSPKIFFEQKQNKVLCPLYKANKRGSSSADWNKAYQAVKHNRVKELEKGNIKHLLHGLAALYVLNLYYKDEQVLRLTESAKITVNSSFGSLLFSVKIYSAPGLDAKGTYEVKEYFDECVFIEDYESETKQRAIEAIRKMDDYMNVASQEELEKLVKDKQEKGETVTEDWARRKRLDILSEKGLLPIRDFNLAKNFNNSLSNLLYNVVLNKRQYT